MSLLPYEETRKLYDVARLFEWDKWQKEIPFIPVKPEWLFRSTPPFGVGVARFNIKHKDFPESFVSVYLDCYDQAGCVGSPYWEVYPIGGDCERFGMTDVNGLADAISRSLAEQTTTPPMEAPRG